jgi:hypothetical protein
LPTLYSNGAGWGGWEPVPTTMETKRFVWFAVLVLCSLFCVLYVITFLTRIIAAFLPTVRCHLREFIREVLTKNQSFGLLKILAEKDFLEKLICAIFYLT